MALGDRLGTLGSRFRKTMQSVGGYGTSAAHMTALKHNYAVTQENAQGWVVRGDTATNQFRKQLEGQAAEVYKTGVPPPGFDSKEEYIQAYRDAHKEMDDLKHPAPATIGRFFGQKAANVYRNETGYAPYQYGQGNRLDEYASQLTQDGSGYNIMIRGFGKDAEGVLKAPQNVQLYTSPGTYSGRRVEDLAAEGGDAAVEAGTYQPMPLETDSALFHEYKRGLSQRGQLRSDVAYAAPDRPGFDMFDISSQARFEQEKKAIQTAADQGHLNFTESQEALAAAEAAHIAVTPRDSTTAVTAGMATLPGATDTTIPEPEDDGTGTGEKPGVVAKVEPPLTPGEGVKDEAGQFLMGEDLYTHLKSFEVGPEGGWFTAPKRHGDYVAVPGQIPYGMRQDQWDSLTYDQAQEIRAQHVADSKSNLEELYRSSITGSPATGSLAPGGADVPLQGLAPGLMARKGALRTELDERKRKATRADDALIKEVENFYALKRSRGIAGSKGTLSSAGRTVGGKSKEEFLKVLAEDPEKLAEFKESPFAFAEKYKDGGLYPDTIPQGEKDTAGVKGEEAAGTDPTESAAVKAVVTQSSGGPITTPQDLEALRNRVNKLRALDKKGQQKLVDFIEKREGKLEALSKYERAFVVMNLAAASAQDSELFKTVAKTLPLFIETGNYDKFTEELKLNWAQVKTAEDRVEVSRQAEGRLERTLAVNIEAERNKMLLDQQKEETSAGQLGLSILKAERDWALKLRKIGQEIRNQSERGRKHWEKQKDTRFVELMNEGLQDEIQTTDLNEFLYNAAVEMDSLARVKNVEIDKKTGKGVIKGTWGHAQKADNEAVLGQVNMALKVIVPRFAMGNMNVWQDFLNLIGGSYSEDFEALDLQQPLMAVGRDNKPIVITADTNPNSIKEFWVTDAAGNRTKGAISLGQVQRVFGKDVGVKMMMLLVKASQS